MRPQLLAIWALVLSWLLAFTLDNWAFLLLGTLDEVRSGELMLIFFLRLCVEFYHCILSPRHAKKIPKRVEQLYNFWSPMMSLTTITFVSYILRDSACSLTCEVCVCLTC